MQQARQETKRVFKTPFGRFFSPRLKQQVVATLQPIRAQHASSPLSKMEEMRRRAANRNSIRLDRATKYERAAGQREREEKNKREKP